MHCEGPEAGPEVQCPVMEVLRNGRPVAAGLFLRHKLGHRMPIHVFAFPLRDFNGRNEGRGGDFRTFARGKKARRGVDIRIASSKWLPVCLPWPRAGTFTYPVSFPVIILGADFDRDVRAASDPATRWHGDAAPGYSRTGQDHGGVAARASLSWMLERLEVDRNYSRL